MESPAGSPLERPDKYKTPPPRVAVGSPIRATADFSLKGPYGKVLRHLLAYPTSTVSPSHRSPSDKTSPSTFGKFGPESSTDGWRLPYCRRRRPNTKIMSPWYMGRRKKGPIHARGYLSRACPKAQPDPLTHRPCSHLSQTPSRRPTPASQPPMLLQISTISDGSSSANSSSSSSEAECKGELLDPSTQQIPSAPTSPGLVGDV